MRDADRPGAVTVRQEDARDAGLAARAVRTRPVLPRGAPANWRGALREVAVIAAGALAALGAQAWWQDREDRGRERDYLRQLLVDTRENERRVEHAVAGDSVTQQEIARVRRALSTQGPPPPADTLVAWLDGTTFSAADLQPVTGSYAALISTGDLRLVRTDSLRTRLVTYAGSLEDRQTSLRFYVQQAFGDPTRIVRAMPFMLTLFADGPGAVRLSDADVAQLRRDPNVAGLLFTLHVANSNRLGILRGLRDETRRLRRALEAEHVDGAPAR